jgi:hypothetical protein
LADRAAETKEEEIVLKRVLAVAAAAATLAGIGASTATAAPSGAFLCYSKWQIEPGYYSFKGGEANTLFSQGYWSPYAQTSVVTKTRISGGWYLLCNLQQPAISTTLQRVPNTWMNLADATLSPNMFKGAGQPTTAGYYPQAR